MGKVSSLGLMAGCIKDNLSMVCVREKVYTSGQMEENMMENGKTKTSMAKGNTHQTRALHE